MFCATLSRSVTKLAVPIMVGTIERALAKTARAAEWGADLIEFRIDRFYRDPEGVGHLVAESPLPCILTCRLPSEGGHFDGEEADRIRLLNHLATFPRKPAYVDIELDSYQQHHLLREAVDGLVGQPARSTTTAGGLILSAHDFDHRPADLYQRIEAMAAAPACRVIKVAWKARSLRDNLEAFEIIGGQYKPTIALCMGEFGLPSRVLAKKFGAFLTFAALEDDSGTAPGQPTLAQLKQLYRWDSQSGSTRVFGVIGDPVTHSLSPAIHNAGFEAIGFDGVYLPLRIPTEYEHFKATVGSFLSMESLHFSGASVTIPHKQNLLRFVDEHEGAIEPLAAKIGAANTLTLPGGNVPMYASNTDYAAALDGLCKVMGIGRADLGGFSVAVIGSGGAARAIVAGLAHHGATVVIYNRTLQKAQTLADEFADSSGKVAAARLAKLCDSCCHVFINCTPVGMHPNVDATPMPLGPEGKTWQPGTVVFDTIYNPVETRLLRDARASGCLTLSGTEMFIRQAAAQFKLWTGHDAPADFGQVVDDQLA